MKKIFLFASIVSFLLGSCETKLVEKVELIPAVENVEIHNGAFNLKQLSSISVPASWNALAGSFAADVKRTTALSIESAEQAVLKVEEDASLASEAYTLNIEQKQIVIKAADMKGAAHGLTSLHQLIMKAINGKLPVLSIQDKPVFGYRGLMLDCSRHFWTVDELKETIDHIAFFKFNTLHLHITDNQGWRMAMDKYPELTQAGTYYANYPELSGKYYTKEDLKEVVRYAESKGVEIIPEIDLPGHATALLAALPELSCKGGKFETYPEESKWSERKRTNENMVCIGNQKVYEFVADVVEELVEIFPSKYIHLGGDEVPTKIWEKCAKCQALYKKEGMKKPGEIQDYFTRKMSELIQSKGKTMIGWDEIDERHAATPADMLAIWRDNGVKQQEAAFERGIPMIMCPQHGCYYDWGYAGNSTRKVYEWNPLPATVTPEQRALVKGGQAALWTERVATQDRVEWMLFPRICALAEVLWTSEDNKNWEDFYQRITSFYPVMKTLGINYYEDDALNEKEFKASKEIPALVRNATIDTNIPTVDPYHKEYAFDGRTNSFFWGATSIDASHYFTINLGEPLPVKEVKVITGDSKDYITKGDLLVSEDGTNFTKVASFDELGEANAQFEAKALKAVKIQVTGQHTCWPIIKEIILK